MVKSDFCFSKIKYISTQSVGLCTFFSIKYTKPRSVYFFFNKVHKVSICVLFLNKIHRIQCNVPDCAIMIKVHKMQICVLMYFISTTSNSQITKNIRTARIFYPVTSQTRFFLYRRTIP